MKQSSLGALLYPLSGWVIVYLKNAALGTVRSQNFGLDT
jgi:hypothetical protein